METRTGEKSTRPEVDRIVPQEHFGRPWEEIQALIAPERKEQFEKAKESLKWLRDDVRSWLNGYGYDNDEEFTARFGTLLKQAGYRELSDVVKGFVVHERIHQPRKYVNQTEYDPITRGFYSSMPDGNRRKELVFYEPKNKVSHFNLISDRSVPTERAMETHFSRGRPEDTTEYVGKNERLLVKSLTLLPGVLAGVGYSLVCPISGMIDATLIALGAGVLAKIDVEKPIIRAIQEARLEKHIREYRSVIINDNVARCKSGYGSDIVLISALREFKPSDGRG